MCALGPRRYSNTPHRLLRLDLRHGREYEFTLVVSQIKKVADVNFSVRAFCSTAPVVLRKINSVFHSEVAVNGQWMVGHNAVGCQNYGHYFQNPQCVRAEGRKRQRLVVV